MAAGVASSGPLRVLGRYALYDEIASGGMAAVHLGRLLGPVGFSRTVAIKRLHAHYAKDPEFVAMFLDEARLAARIRHPNVVQTIDVVAQENELFLVMEYVQGDALGRLIRAVVKRGERIPVPFAFAIIAGVLHGLHAAHEARGEHGEALDIVHRDVSPQNVLVGVDGVARLLDFGVAKAAGRAQSTRDGQIKGKMAYMSAEQVRGMKLDRRTDVYAAGVVLWETLTGRRLFDGENDVVVFGKVLAGNPPKPSEYAPGLSPEIDALVMRALSLWPSDRFATAREMAKEMEALVPLVAPAALGEWVENIAHDALTARSQKVAHIETQSTDPDAAASSVANAAPRDDDDHTTQRWTPSTPGEEPDTTIATQISTTHMTPIGHEPARAKVRLFAVLGAGAALLGVIGLFIGNRTDQRVLIAPAQATALQPSARPGAPSEPLAEPPAAPVSAASAASAADAASGATDEPPAPASGASVRATVTPPPPRVAIPSPAKPSPAPTPAPAAPQLKRVLDSRK